MAFDAHAMSVMAYANGFTLWHYRSPQDLMAALLQDAFFDPAADLLRPADVMILQDPAGATGFRRVQAVDADGVTLAALS